MSNNALGDTAGAAMIPGRWMRAGWSMVSSLLFVTGIVAWALLLRPVSLGGPAEYIVVHGNSMVPTYHEGDLVVVHAQTQYATGDIVAYRVPKPELGAGHLVIHRIAGGSAAAGFAMRGDHNPNADPWHPHLSDVAGSSWILLPGMGRVLTLARNPWVMAGVAALVAALGLFKPRSLWARGHGAASPGENANRNSFRRSRRREAA